MIGKFIRFIVGDVTSNQLNVVIYTLLGSCPFVIGYLSSDDAAKHIPPAFLFYLKGIIGAVNAALATLKAYFSTGYARAKAEKTSIGNTEIITKTT